MEFLRKLRELSPFASLAQYRKWSRPSRQGYAGFLLGIVAFAFSIYAYVVPPPTERKGEAVQWVALGDSALCAPTEGAYELKKIQFATQYLMTSAHQSYDTLESRRQLLQEGLTLLNGAYGEIRQAAEKGNANAKYWDGVYHEIGAGGLQRNWKKAEALYREAGASVACARISLIHLYFAQGRIAEGYRLLIDPANSGDTKGQVILADILLKNPDLLIDGKRLDPLAMLHLAAAGGEPSAYYHLGQAHLAGTATEPDRSKALFYFTRGAERGNPASAYELAMLYEAESPELHRKWLEASARAGYAQAQFLLGKSLVSGIPTDSPGYPEGVKWLTFAATAENSDAMVWLGALHEHGLGVEKNHRTALRYLCRAAIAENPNAVLEIERIGKKSDWKDLCWMQFWLAEMENLAASASACQGIANCTEKRDRR